MLPARAAGCRPGRVDALRQLGVHVLLDVVAQHGKDFLHKGVQLLLEQQRRILGLHLQPSQAEGCNDGCFSSGSSQAGHALAIQLCEWCRALHVLAVPSGERTHAGEWGC